MRTKSLIHETTEAVRELTGSGGVAPVARIEDLRLRNYDGDAGHRIDVRLEDDDGVVFEERYDLPPGAALSEVRAASPGEYDVTVEVDGEVRAEATCRVDEWPEGTVLIEFGNGVVAVSNDGT